MANIRFRKEKISIQNIGRERFWFGVAAGVISAISISLAFNHFREVYRYMTTLSTDLLILEAIELQFYNYFYSTLATVLGFSITIWFWMSNQAHSGRKDRIYKQLARTNALVIFWVILMVIVRYGSILPILIYGMPGYDNQLNLFEEYWILFILMPTVVFMQSWSSVRLVYRSGKWILYSIIFCILTVFALDMTTTVDQDKLNGSYHQRFEKDYQYIDQEITKAQTDYGIEFDTKTIDILKKWYTESSVEQIKSVKKAFSLGKPVSMDTIILQKIIIRNFKHGGWIYNRRNSIENWQYAQPKDILKQLDYYDSNSNQTKELIEIVKEQIDLVNTPEFDLGEFKNYTETERRRSRGARYNIPVPLIMQLKEVRKSLLEAKKYTDLTKELPVINNRERKE